jgi:RNA polymerase sigma-70 factor (ECF subfamily)
VGGSLVKTEAGSDFQSLVAKAKDGDADAAGDLLWPYRERLWRLAYRLLQHDEDAKDAVQDAFLKAFRCLKKLRASDQKGLEVWLVTITVNCSKDRYASRVGLTSLGDDPPEYSDDRHLLVDDQTILHLRLQAGLQSLAFGKRSAVVLVDMYGWTRKEAARMLGVPQGTIDSWVHDARARLRRALGESE